MQGKVRIVTHVMAPAGQAGADAQAAVMYMKKQKSGKIVFLTSAGANFTISQRIPFSGG